MTYTPIEDDLLIPPNVFSEHIGVFLREEFLTPMGLNIVSIAKATGLTELMLSQIINGKRKITVDISLVLDRFFGLSDGYFLRVQSTYRS